MNDEHRAEELNDEARARAFFEQLKQLRTEQLAAEMVERFVEFGALKMGLNEGTKELRDLDDVRLAIELLRSTIAVLERERGEESVRVFRAGLAQLQLDYARVARGDAEGQEPAAEPGPDEAQPGAEA